MEGAVAEYVDQASGSRADRAGLRTLLEAAHRREFDVVLIFTRRSGPAGFVSGASTRPRTLSARPRFPGGMPPVKLEQQTGVAWSTLRRHYATWMPTEQRHSLADYLDDTPAHGPRDTPDMAIAGSRGGDSSGAKCVTPKSRDTSLVQLAVLAAQRSGGGGNRTPVRR
jgi:hypothetical protein